MKEAKALGIEKLEISGNNILGREDELGQELAYTELGISGIPAYFDFGRDLDVKKQSEPILEAARYLGADKLLVIPGFLQEQDSREVQEKQIQNMVDSVNALAELAAGYGVALVMEEYDLSLIHIFPCQDQDQHDGEQQRQEKGQCKGQDHRYRNHGSLPESVMYGTDHSGRRVKQKEKASSLSWYWGSNAGPQLLEPTPLIL